MSLVLGSSTGSTKPLMAKELTVPDPPCIQGLSRALSNLLTSPFAVLPPVKVVRSPAFPGGWFAVNQDKPGTWLVPIPLHRIELPWSVSCFPFLGQVDSVIFGVHLVRPSVSEGLSFFENRR